MLLQLLIGSGIIVLATAAQALVIGIGMIPQERLSRQIRRAGLGLKSLSIALAALWMLLGQTLAVWTWALAMVWLGAFDSIEPSLYFSFAAYTTLGFGDVLPPIEWRILGAMAGANGMLGFGLAAAGLIEFVQRIGPDE